MAQPSIILIGPVRTGKSTLAIQLASLEFRAIRWMIYAGRTIGKSHSTPLTATR
jgi:hypothetical protein